MYKEEHFDLFVKPKRVDMSSPIYAKYKHVARELDYVVEYFRFEELRKKGFTSQFLTKNPYEGEFADFVTTLEEHYKHLPEYESHVRVLEALEAKHRLAVQSVV